MRALLFFVPCRRCYLWFPGLYWRRS